MARMTETELRRALRKISTSDAPGPSAERVGATWEYTEPVLYLAYAVGIANATSSGIITNQSDATSFQLTPFNPSGALLDWRGYSFSKSMYQSGDATDYIWEDITAHSASVNFLRFYTNSDELMVNLGTPDTPGTGVTWISVDPAASVPASAFWVAEQYTINSVKSEWALYPVKAGVSSNMGVISYTKAGSNKPVLNDAVWQADVLLAATAFTGLPYSSHTELGYGSVVVIGYDDGKLYGILKSVSDVDTWVLPAEFIDGDLIVDGTVTTDHLAANTITAGDISADTITSNEIAADTITATEIVASTITATEIAASTITADKISTYALTSTNATLENAIVGTLSIAGNAVTQPVVSTVASSTSGTTAGTWFAAGSITIDNGSSVGTIANLITFSSFIYVTSGGNWTASYRLKRGTTIIDTGAQGVPNNTAGGIITSFFLDTTASGSNTYSMEFKGYGDVGSPVYANNRKIHVLGAKR